MPLAFPSKSHETVVFGFFNIETDMLLLENLFFFADRFCQAAVSLAEKSEGPDADVRIDGFRIEDPAMMGSLHAAIHGVDFSGFIGEVYRQFPFPDNQAGFKQRPYGEKNRSLVEGLIHNYGKDQPIHLIWDEPTSTVSIEQFVFDQMTFGALIAYVIRGGYPRWRDGIRPHYVQEMMEKLSEISSPLFLGGEIFLANI